MNFDNIPAGKDLPNDIYVWRLKFPLITRRLSMKSYNRWVPFWLTASWQPMFYPANYGFIPHTLAEHGRPAGCLGSYPPP